MNLNDYQSLAARTAASHDNELVNYGLGIAGEAGEVADLIKKAIFHGHKIEHGEIKKELGDVLWYLANIARIAGLTLVSFYNILLFIPIDTCLCTKSLWVSSL